jgi:cell division transport system ATP-binding protein
MRFIELKNVYKVYKNGVTALADLSLKIDKGEFVFVIGATASGKSTFIKLLYREERPTRGMVNVGGINIAKLRNGKVYKLRRKIGIVFQDYKLLPKLTVYENVAFALEVTGVDSKQIRKRVIDVLDKVGLKHKDKEYPDKLSGGEQQRVAIARAIVNDPKLILCDEPTGNLDPKMSLEIVKVLDDINRTIGTTVIMATHDKEIVNKFKKRVVVLKQGRMVKDYEEGKYDNEAI